MARRLRADDGQVRLAFATSSNDFASESYEAVSYTHLDVYKRQEPLVIRAVLPKGR